MIQFHGDRHGRKTALKAPRHVTKPSNLRRIEKEMCGENKSNNWKTSENEEDKKSRAHKKRKKEKIFWVIS